MYKAMLTGLLVFSPLTFAGWIAQETTVVAMESVSNNQNTFTAILRGGSGPCVSTTGDILVYFPRNEASDAEIHNRSYSMLLSALATGQKVSIYNYKDDTCTKAVGVRLIK